MDQKERVFLDASVIRHLEQRDAPEKRTDTWAFWNLLMEGTFDVYVSEGVQDDLEGCDAEQLALLHSHLEKLPHHTVHADAEAIELANQIVSLGVLPQKRFSDCVHIASAILSGCTMFVSWDFRHIVNYKTSRGIRAITLLNGYQDLEVCLPSMLLGEDAAEDSAEGTLENAEVPVMPVLSDRFDLEDIRRIREYNSLRYLSMTNKEILADIHEGAKRYRQRAAVLGA